MPIWVSYCLRIVVWASVTIGVSHGEWLPSFSRKFLANYVKTNVCFAAACFPADMA